MARASGKSDQAIELLHRAETTLPGNVETRFYLGRLHHDLGLLYEEQKNFDLAEENLKTALAVLPTLPHRFDLGEFYFDRVATRTPWSCLNKPGVVFRPRSRPYISAWLAPMIALASKTERGSSTRNTWSFLQKGKIAARHCAGYLSLSQWLRDE